MPWRQRDKPKMEINLKVWVSIVMVRGSHQRKDLNARSLPDIYQMAAGHMGLDPSECIVLNMHNGVQAAKALDRSVAVSPRVSPAISFARSGADFT